MRKAPPPTKKPDDLTEPKPPFPSLKMEQMVIDALDVDDQGIALTALQDLAQACVDLARRRNVLDEPFIQILTWQAEMLIKTCRLEAAAFYRMHLNEGGVETPHLRETEKKLCEEINQLRMKMVDFMKKLGECPPPGTMIS